MAPGAPEGSLTELGAGEGAVNLIAWAGYVEDGSTDPKVDWVTSFEEETGCQVTNKYPDGTLIQYLGSSMIWYIEDGLKHLVSANVFDLNKFKPEVVIKNVSANIVYETGWHLEKF